MSFTVIGDTVNTAARLQTLTRTLGTPLVVGDPLILAVKALSPEISSELMEQMVDHGEHDLRGEPARCVSGRASRRARKTARLPGELARAWLRDPRSTRVHIALSRRP